MSSRTHNEFGIEFPRKRLSNLKTFANKAGLLVKHNELWDTIKSIIMISKESHRYASGDF
jgi:acyl carrier protein